MNELKVIFGDGEIKRFDKQIKDAFEILKTCQLKHNGVTYNKIKSICDLGFHHNSSSGNAFLGKNQVIKIAVFTRRPPPIKYRVPTVIYAYDNISPREWDFNYIIAIQPKIDIDYHLGDKAISYFSRRLAGNDFHIDNYGLYKGEIKLFDW
jgi:hypothetical protein